MVRRVAILAAITALSCAPSPERSPRVAVPNEAAAALAPSPPRAEAEASDLVVERPGGEGSAAGERLEAEPGEAHDPDHAHGPNHAHGPDHAHDHAIVDALLPTVDPQMALLGLEDEALHALIERDLADLGSVSVGKANGGALLNGVRMPTDGNWEIIDPARSYATQETVDYLVGAIEAVNTAFPEGTHPMYIGHLSREGGGYLRPHRSHQSGRDVDLGYYYVPERAEWYRPATPHTLDRARTWAFVRALVTQTDVEYIFISTRVQMLLKEYALSIGEDPQWLDTVFQFRSRNPEPIIRHTWGHRTHMHVRFFNPKAQAVGIRAYDALARQRIISPRVRLQPYLARPGDSYASLAPVAGHSAKTIERTNLGKAVQPGHVLLVPIRGSVHKVGVLEVPPRRLPPKPATSDAHVIAAPAGG